MSNEMAMQAGMEDEVDSQIETNPQIEITPSISRDEALHGGGDDTNETPDSSESDITQVERPTPPTPIKTFFSTIVSALGRHEVEVTDPKGNKKVLKSRDVFELEQEQFARLRATESKEKWDGSSETSKWKKFGQGAVRFFDRMWRSTVTEKVHLAKEKKHGMELSATVGIEGAISEEFNALIDKKARERIGHERDTGWKRFKGKTKDFFQELIGHERDLHKYKVKAAEELVTEYRSNPADTKHPLYQLINRDTATREELAARIGESPLELIKQTNAKDKKVTNIKLEGEAGAKVDHFLKHEIIGKAMDDILDQATKDGGRPTKIRSGVRQELDQKIRDFFFSTDFQAWRATLKPEEQAAFENSFTVASDILLQFEEGGMAENIHQCREHYQGANRLDFDIELSLGTAQLSAHTESMGEAGFLERRRERASLNEKLLRQFKNHDPYSPENMGPGLRRERMLSAAHAIFNNEFTAAWLTAVGGRSLIKSASTAAHAIPIIGSAFVAGGVAGVKEWARHGQMRATYGMARAEGLQFPEAMNAVRAKEMESADYQRIEFGNRTQQFLELSDRLKSGSRDENTILLALATAADSTARLQLGSERDINLLVASVDGPEGRGIRNRELRIHDQARSALTAQLTEIINGNQALADQLSATIGVLPGNANVHQNQHTAENMLELLRLHRYDNLLNGTQVSGSLHEAIGSLSIADSEAIRARDQAYRKLRKGSTFKRALTTAVIAGGVGALGAGLSHYSELHEQVVQSNTEHQLVPLLDHNTPTHVDPLETAHITHPVTGEELGAMHAHVPAGTHIEAMQVRVGGPDDLETHYNLVTNVLKTDGQPTVLVRDMQFDHEGKLEITPGIRDFLNHNHIKVDYTSHDQTIDVTDHAPTVEPPTTTEIDYTHWTNTLAYKDMPNGPDGYWAENLNHSFSANPDTSVDVDRVTDINGIRYFLRGMENWIYKQENFKVDDSDGYHHVLHGGESIWSKLTGKPEYLVQYQAPTAEIIHLPALFTTEEGNRRIADLIHESIKENPTGDINHVFSDDAHRIAWEMSYWGDEPHVPDANEVRTLLEYFGELPKEAVSATENIAVPANDIWFTFTKDLSAVAEVPTTQVFTQTIPGWTQFIAGSIGYSRPLEAPVGKPSTRSSEYDNYYSETGFTEGKRLRDILAFSSGNSGNQNRNPQVSNAYSNNYGEPTYLTEESNKVEGQRVIEQLTTELTKSDRIYVTLGGAIGDAVIGANYVSALQAGITALGRNIPITVIINDNHKNLFANLGPNISIEVAQRGQAKSHVESLVASRPDTTPVVFDFENYSSNRPMLTQQTVNGKTTTIINDLFAPAIQLYNNKTDGDRRYTHFIEEILNLRADQISPDTAQFKVSLPPNKDQVYRDMARKYGIDQNKEQIGIVVEASMEEKRYPLDKWLDLVQKLGTTKPNAEFNILYNERSGHGTFNKANMERAISRLPATIRNKIHLIPGDLSESAVIMSQQSYVLSNDTGLAHIAGHIDNGPKVVTLHVPRFSPDLWISNPTKQTALVSSNEDISNISTDEIVNIIV